MSKRQKEYKELMKQIHNTNSVQLDEEGRKIVNISIADDSCFLSPYSTLDAPIISDEMADFLEHSVKHISPKSKIHFIIKSKTIDENEKKIYPLAIKNYYGSEFVEITRDLNHNKWLSIIMIIIGAFFFALDIFLGHFNSTDVLLNIIDVIAWVFVWEAVDLFVLQRSSLKLKRHRCYELIHSKLSFNEE